MKTFQVAPVIGLIILLSAFSLPGCKYQRPGDIEIDFQLVDNGTPVGLGHVFETGSGVDAKIEKVWFYVSNITLNGSDDEEIEEIKLVKLDNDGFGGFSTEAPKGKYEKITFGIGVPDYLNDADPSQFSEEGHPLNVTENMYWGMAGKYRFLSIDGKSDQEQDGVFENTFSYHTGYSESYRTVSFERKVTVSKKEENLYLFYIDISLLFDKSGTEVDVVNEPNYHGSLSDLNLSERIATNFSSAISLQN